MIDARKLVEEAARASCNAACRNTCHCRGKIKCTVRLAEAQAATALVLRAVAEELRDAKLWAIDPDERPTIFQERSTSDERWDAFQAGGWHFLQIAERHFAALGPRQEGPLHDQDARPDRIRAEG